jgi:polysaccharide pyruvyl transferase WcaK-like protein
LDVSRKIEACSQNAAARHTRAQLHIHQVKAPTIPEAAIVRVAIFNVKYSPNLGDGIIAECLEGELRRADPRLQPISIDIGGRTQFSTAHGRHRKTLLSVLERLPKTVRSLVVPAVLIGLVRLRHAPRWRRQLANCDVAVVGGGALFADADQNFPIKIGQALDLARERDIPIAVASVGVSSGWSRSGRHRLSTRLLKARIISLSVRDAASGTTWRSLLGTLGVSHPKVAPDPGLLSARQYGKGVREETASRKIALCVTAPIALRLHHEQGHADGHLESWMRAVALDLTRRGCQVTLFTNGSPEDRLFRDCLRARLSCEKVDVAPDFVTPGELARFVSQFDCVLAHRLHACIVAYSYGIPTVGFAWDKKLQSFFQQTSRDRFVIDPREISPMDLGDLALDAIAQGIDAPTHEHLLKETTSAIHTLARQLCAAREDRAS